MIQGLAAVSTAMLIQMGGRRPPLAGTAASLQVAIVAYELGEHEKLAKIL